MIELLFDLYRRLLPVAVWWNMFSNEEVYSRTFAICVMFLYFLFKTRQVTTKTRRIVRLLRRMFSSLSVLSFKDLQN